jgi:hypothetical protein
MAALSGPGFQRVPVIIFSRELEKKMFIIGLAAGAKKIYLNRRR